LTFEPIEDVVIVPHSDYALDWVESFKTAVPELRDRAREVYLTITGHSDWRSMEKSCSKRARLFDFDKLTPEERRLKCFRMRKILVEVFNIRPSVANHLSWVNPPGSQCIWGFHTLESSAMLADGLPPDLDQIYVDLDELNMGYCIDTEQGQRRLRRRPEIGAHLGLCNRLGWDLDLLGDVDEQLKELGAPGQFIAEPVAFAIDPDLGRVPVFVAGFTSTPGHAHDEVLVEYLTAALSTAELLNGPGSPGIVFYESSVCRKKDGHFYTCFGSLVINNDWKDLFLNETCTSVSDVLVNLITTSFQKSEIQAFADTGLRLQKMFERARQKHLLPLGDVGTLLGMESPSGWCSLELRPTT
jgi:hypothetical protein